MKRISGTQIVINFIGSKLGCTYSEIRTGTGLALIDLAATGSGAMHR